MALPSSAGQRDSLRSLPRQPNPGHRRRRYRGDPSALSIAAGDPFVLGVDLRKRMDESRIIFESSDDLPQPVVEACRPHPESDECFVGGSSSEWRPGASEADDVIRFGTPLAPRQSKLCPSPITFASIHTDFRFCLGRDRICSRQGTSVALNPLLTVHPSDSWARSRPFLKDAHRPVRGDLLHGSRQRGQPRWGAVLAAATRPAPAPFNLRFAATGTHPT